MKGHSTLTSQHARSDSTPCQLCPRLCGARRGLGERGICGADDRLVVARAALHFWEEPPISGRRGSGTVFFSNCSLGCVYCQNAALSRGLVGKAIPVERLAQIFGELQQAGAHNINLVTPTHYSVEIAAALTLARQSPTALTIPIVYNTSGYELPRIIRGLSSHIDIYLTDFKYASKELSAAYSGAADYPQVAMAALREMVSQRGDYRTDGDGMLQSGVIVRHLLLPGHLDDAKLVISRLFAEFGNAICYSLMNQYTPMPGVPANLQRKVTESEYSELIDFALDLGITNSFMQEGATADESFIPPFDLSGV